MKQILFNTEMVRALLEGRKTVTRRVVKPQPAGKLFPMEKESCWPGYWSEAGSARVVKPPYQPGDVLWVRETWCEVMGRKEKYLYRAYAGERDDTRDYAIALNTWRPSIHMPREVARIFLRVNGVRVERLQAITEDDAEAEGAEKMYPYTDPETGETAFLLHQNGTFRAGFSQIWDNTIKSADRATCGWDANPWVWVIEFEKISKEEAINGA